MAYRYRSIPAPSAGTAPAGDGAARGFPRPAACLISRELSVRPPGMSPLDPCRSLTSVWPAQRIFGNPPTRSRLTAAIASVTSSILF